jgi:hypothetical protein
MKELYKILKKKSHEIHKYYSVRMKGPDDIVVPQVLISNEILGKMLEKEMELQSIIRKNCYLSIYRTCKQPLLDKIPVELTQYITSYLPVISNQMIAYCKWCFLEKTEMQINNIISDNKFDILWYDYGTLDYTWACDTIKEATLQMEYIQKQKKMFLKNARYNP